MKEKEMDAKKQWWLIHLEQAYDNYEGMYIDDKECKELFELLKQR